MKIYFASNNQNKKQELQQILPEVQIVCPSDEKIEFMPLETGKSFFENAMIKAKTLQKIVCAPVLADDSGLCVDCLGGKPGIFSARYSGGAFFKDKNSKGKKSLSQIEKNHLIIEETFLARKILQKNGRDDGGKAHFVCAMILLFSDKRFFCAQETMEGKIVQSKNEIRGEGGFGYDPIFLVDGLGKTAAELSETEKNFLSHRGKAVRAIFSLIKNEKLLCE